ncbi:MAG: UvrD-helicase domain-containing protein [Nocardioides sp.]
MGAGSTSFDISGSLPAPGRTMLLEASAGTGKTWTIGALVTRMVAEGRAALDEILVVTYTRAASAELRERVRAQLVEAERLLAQILDGHPPGESVLAGVLGRGTRAEVGQRRQRLVTALADFDAATIVTIHSFCTLVLASLGVAGDVDQSARLAETDELLSQVVGDLWLRDFSDQPTPALSLAVARDIARNAMLGGTSLEPADADPRSPDGIRVGFGRAVRAEMTRRKQAAGLLSYDDLLQQLADTLAEEDAPARTRMRRRWSVVLIDEFQDTDPVSWQVFDRAFTGHAAMVLIGDPKQAIYGFRGGDVFAYLSAARAADQRLTLDTNFRSDPGVVTGVHTLMESLELGDPEIVVHPINAHRTENRLVGAPHLEPVRLRGVLRGDLSARPQQGRLPAVAKVRSHIAADLAADIARLLTSGATFEDRRLQAGDVAVLATRHEDLRTIQKALRAEGVPAVVAGSGTVFTTPAARHWLRLLEAMEAPNRVDRTRAAALTWFFGHRAQQLADDQALTDRVAEQVRTMLEACTTGGPAAVLELANAAGLPERLLGVLGGERDLTDLRQIAELLHAESIRSRLGVMALRTWLGDQMLSPDAGDLGDRTRRLDSDALAVQLVTIHASKGLQYPVVYLPSLADRWVRTPPMPMYHDLDGRRCVWVGEDDGPGHQQAVAAEAREASGESLRLLYVAMTRAQAQVVAWWAVNTNCPESALHRVLMRSGPEVAQLPGKGAVGSDEILKAALIGWRDRGAYGLERSEITAVTARVEVRDDTPIGVRTFDRPVDLAWRRTSYSALSRRDGSGHPGPGVGSEPEEVGKDDEAMRSGSRSESVAGDRGDQVAPLSGQPAGARFGSLVHAVLEHVDPGAEDLVAELTGHLVDQLVRWPEDVDIPLLAQALAAVLRTPLGPLADGRTLREIGLANRLAEVEFEMPLGGGWEPTPGRTPLLGDLAGLLTDHLPAGDPVRGYVEQLGDPMLAGRTLRGYLTGSIDVVLRVVRDGQPRYLVVDYKTNRLGSALGPSLLADYAPPALDRAMTGSDYPLQALLYAVTLHRFLRWRQPGYQPERHLGGVLYLYLRGMAGPDTPTWDTPLGAAMPAGVFSWKPPVALVEAVSALLDGPGASDA